VPGAIEAGFPVIFELIASFKDFSKILGRFSSKFTGQFLVGRPHGSAIGHKRRPWGGLRFLKASLFITKANEFTKNFLEHVH